MGACTQALRQQQHNTCESFRPGGSVSAHPACVLTLSCVFWDVCEYSRAPLSSRSPTQARLPLGPDFFGTETPPILALRGRPFGDTSRSAEWTSSVRMCVWPFALSPPTPRHAPATIRPRGQRRRLIPQGSVFPWVAHEGPSPDEGGGRSAWLRNSSTRRCSAQPL